MRGNSLIKLLKRWAPTKIHESKDGAFTVWKHSRWLKREKKVYQMYRNYKIRQAFENLTYPVLNRTGIEDVSIKNKDMFEDIETLSE